MRRINSRKLNSGNPGLMFAQGVEQIIREKLAHPTSYDDQEVRNFKRMVRTRVPAKNLFSLLFRQFTY